MKVLAGLAAGSVATVAGLWLLAAYERNKTKKPADTTSPYTKE